MDRDHAGVQRLHHFEEVGAEFRRSAGIDDHNRLLNGGFYRAEGIDEPRRQRVVAIARENQRHNFPHAFDLFPARAVFPVEYGRYASRWLRALHSRKSL